jgi:site-specific recombinase XerD
VAKQWQKVRSGEAFRLARILTVQRGRRTVVVNGHAYRYDPCTLWRLVFDVWLPTGRRQITREFRSRDEAYSVLADAEGLEARSRRSLLSPADVEYFHRLGLLGEADARFFLGRSPNVSWSELRERYERRSAARCRPETHLKNVSRAAQAIRRIADDIPNPSKCSRESIEAFVRRRKAAGAQNKSVNMDLDVLRQLLDPAFSPGQNPARAIAKLNVAIMGRLPRALKPEEDEKAMRLAWKDRERLSGVLWPLYLVYRFTGLRRQEALVLPDAHILEDRVLVQNVSIPERALGKGYRLENCLWRPKAWEARAVPTPYLPEWVLRPIRDVAKRRSFPFAPEGKLLHPDVVSQAFDDVLSNVSPSLTLHDLRHTCITAWMEQGVPAAVVQRLAGHKRLATTERYTHVAVKSRKRNLQRIAKSWL